MFPRAKFLCHISHALQSSLTDFCGIITVNLYSRTDTDEKWINNNYNFGINDCRACNLWQRKCGRVLEPLCPNFVEIRRSDGGTLIWACLSVLRKLLRVFALISVKIYYITFLGFVCFFFCCFVVFFWKILT